DVAGRQIKIGLDAGCDRGEPFVERRLLPDHHDLVWLYAIEIEKIRRRLDIRRTGDLDVNTDMQIGPRVLVLEPPYDRSGVALVEDPVEVDVAEPTSSFCRGVGQPQPVLQVVDIAGTVRLDHWGLSHRDGVVQSPE